MNGEFTKVLYPELSYKLVGTLYTIHNDHGRFRSEKQYCDAIENELTRLKIPFKREVILPTSFSGEQAGRNKADFVIDDKIILEVKAKRMLLREDYYQVKRYLVSDHKKLGIIVNFRQRYLSPKRILN